MSERTSANSLWRRLPALAMLLAAGLAVAQPLRDPTRRTSQADAGPAPRAESGPRWRLQSTLVADSRRLAVINGRTVAAGDRIDGAVVREVRQEGVTLEIDGRRVELRMLGTVDVKRAGG